jgi:hypothetical protein
VGGKDLVCPASEQEVKIFLAVLDDIAGVCFPTLDGKVDMAAMILLADVPG